MIERRKSRKNEDWMKNNTVVLYKKIIDGEYYNEKDQMKNIKWSSILMANY